MSLIPAVQRQRQRQTDLCKLKSAWSTWQVPGQPGLHRKTLSQIEKKQQTKTKHRQEARINPEEEAQGFKCGKRLFSKEQRVETWGEGVAGDKNTGNRIEVHASHSLAPLGSYHILRPISLHRKRRASRGHRLPAVGCRPQG